MPAKFDNCNLKFEPSDNNDQRPLEHTLEFQEGGQDCQEGVQDGGFEGL